MEAIGNFILNIQMIISFGTVICAALLITSGVLSTCSEYGTKKHTFWEKIINFFSSCLLVCLKFMLVNLLIMTIYVIIR